jgi:hypothetical protein
MPNENQSTNEPGPARVREAWESSRHKKVNPKQLGLGSAFDRLTRLLS